MMKEILDEHLFPEKEEGQVSDGPSAAIDIILFLQCANAIFFCIFAWLKVEGCVVVMVFMTILAVLLAMNVVLSKSKNIILPLAAAQMTTVILLAFFGVKYLDELTVDIPLKVSLFLSLYALGFLVLTILAWIKWKESL